MLGSITSLQVGAACASLLFDDLGVAGVSFLRLGIAGLLLMVLVRPRCHRWSGRQWVGSLLLGVCLALMNITFYEAVARVPLGIAIAVQFTGPLLMAALSSRRLVDLLPVLSATAGVGIFGAQALGEGADLRVTGLLVAAAAGAFWACYIVAASHVAGQFTGLEGLAVASLVAGLLSAPGGIVAGGAALLDPSALLAGLGIAVLASVVPYVCEMTALRTMPKRIFSILVALEPVVGVAAGLVLLDQDLSAAQGLGVGLIVLAAISVTGRRSGRRPELGAGRGT